MRHQMWCIWIVVAVTSMAWGATDGQTAEEIISNTAVKGGLIVHLGCGDGKLTASLRANESYLVHGLAVDDKAVADARKYIRSQGVYGPVSVDRFNGKHLPYADDMVNLIVAQQLGDISMDEVMRVLSPLGTAYVKNGDKWVKTVKPWPAEIDEWTHYLHDASNNAVAADKRVGEPRRLRWACEPLWARDHEFNSSLCAMVSAKGRLFYIFDEGLTGVTDKSTPEKWMLIARDAFNGVLLWKKPMPRWGAAQWNSRALRSIPPTVSRRLVGQGDNLFITLGYDAPVSVLDAATGKQLRTLPGTEAADEIRCLDGIMIVRKTSGAVTAVQIDTGKKLWEKTGKIASVSMAAGDGRVCFQDGKSVVCVALDTGKQLWKIETPKAATLILALKDMVIIPAGNQLQAIAGDSGQVIWTEKAAIPRGELFAANGKLWHWRGKEIVGHDLKTGKLAEPIDASEVFTPGHHARCYQSKATENYIIAPERGVEFVSLTGAEHSQSDWTRGPCNYGIMPCNGLLYVPPNPCFCYPGVKVTGFNAYAPARSSGHARPADAREFRLERGKAYGIQTQTRITGRKNDWPTYRGDERRTGAGATRVGSAIVHRWTAKLGGRLTPPISVGNQVFVAAKDEHVLYALNALDGDKKWDFVAGGRIDSPPSVCGDMVIFGCADGYAYCLRRADGELIWRLRAAPVDERIVAFGRLESPWRVHGSILIKEGIAYMTTGRSSYLDGGIEIIAIAPDTGQLIKIVTVDTWSRTRKDAENKPFVAGYHMEGTHSDILVSEGDYIYMGQTKFDLNLVEQKMPYMLADANDKLVAIDQTGEPYTAANEDPSADYEKHQRDWMERVQPKLVAELREKHGGFSMGERDMGLHVLSTGGFLDDSWFNRTYWMYAKIWPGFYLGHRGAKTGHLLTVGPERTYVVQAFPSRNLQGASFVPQTTGYLLFADDNDNEPVLDHRTRETPKGWGYGRLEPPRWHQWLPVRIRAMVLADTDLFVAGPPDELVQGDPYASFEGRGGGKLLAVSAKDGEKLAEYDLKSPPVFDGMAAAGGRLFVSTTDGTVLCYVGKR